MKERKKYKTAHTKVGD